MRTNCGKTEKESGLVVTLERKWGCERKGPLKPNDVFVINAL